MIQNIKYKDDLLAIIIPRDFSRPGVCFFTPDDFSQQLGYMNYQAGKKITPHIHNLVNRSVKNTLEVLFIKKGKLRVDFYNEKKNYLESRILNAGDIILLVSGGHGFEVLEDLEMIEVKQGPYAGDEDKSRFDGVIKEINIKKENNE